MLSSLDPSFHHYYITRYYSNILIAVSNIVYIILKVDITVCVLYIIITTSVVDNERLKLKVRLSIMCAAVVIIST